MDLESNKKFIYRGCIHIHTKKSDGTGDINSISLAAKKAGLSWIIITDHNYYDCEEGLYNGVYVIKGEEISPQNGNHYLALDIQNIIEPNDNPQTYIDEVHKQNGFGFVAHPDEIVKRKNKYPALRWDKKYIPDGVEIWNWFSSWGDNYDSSNIFTLANSFLFKNALVRKALQDSLNWWDELNFNSEKIVPAIGGVDAHALKIRDYVIPVTVFPYKTMFKTIQNLLELKQPLSKDFCEAKRQILDAIKSGNNIIINNLVADEKPIFYIQNAQQIAQSGEEIKKDIQTYLNVELKQKMLIKIVWNGQEIHQCFAKNCKLYLSEVGKYRLELYMKNKAFAYSNPISVY